MSDELPCLCFDRSILVCSAVAHVYQTLQCGIRVFACAEIDIGSQGNQCPPCDIIRRLCCLVFEWIELAVGVVDGTYWIGCGIVASGRVHGCYIIKAVAPAVAVPESIDWFYIIGLGDGGFPSVEGGIPLRGHPCPIDLCGLGGRCIGCIFGKDRNMAGLTCHTAYVMRDIGGGVPCGQAGFAAVTVGAGHLHIQICFPQIRPSSCDPVVFGGVTLLAGEVFAAGGHVIIEYLICCIGVSHCHIPSFVVITAAAFGVTLNAVGPYRFVYRLNGLVHGNGHIGGIRHEYAVYLHPFVIFLMTDETVDVLKVGLRGVGRWIGLCAETYVTGPASIPVTHDVDAVAVHSGLEFALLRRSVYHIRGCSLPLIMG